MCRDRNSYSFSVLAELNETIITSLSCRELLATRKMLLQRAGSKNKSDRLQDQVTGHASKHLSTASA